MENGDNGNTLPLSVGRVTSQYVCNNEKYFPIIKRMNVACHFFMYYEVRKTTIKGKNTGKKERKEVVRTTDMWACKMYKKKEAQLERKEEIETKQ